MPAVFQRQDTEIGGVFSSDRAKLTFAANVSGVLVQSLNFNYQQQVTRLYEIGVNPTTNRTSVYYVGGRTQGTGQMNRVIGPGATIQAMYAQYGDVCKAKKNNLLLSLSEIDCSPGGASKNMSYNLKGCVLIQVGVSLNSQDMVINEQCQLMFSGCDYEPAN